MSLIDISTYWGVMHNVILYQYICFIKWLCGSLYYIILYFTIQHYNILYYNILHYNLLYYLPEKGPVGNFFLARAEGSLPFRPLTKKSMDKKGLNKALIVRYLLFSDTNVLFYTNVLSCTKKKYANVILEQPFLPIFIY